MSVVPLPQSRYKLFQSFYTELETHAKHAISLSRLPFKAGAYDTDVSYLLIPDKKQD